MIRRYLGDYQGFVCIADRCPDTCCGGWEIEIDEESLDMYRFLAKDHKVFADNIDFQESCFKQKPNGDCACLREDRLCEIQKNFGEEYLCPTCDLYPRHIEEFPGVREYSISLSCPAAAFDFIKNPVVLSFTEHEDEMEDEDDYQDFNSDLYQLLLKARKDALSILENQDITLRMAFDMMLDFVAGLQDMYDEGDFSIVSYEELKQSHVDNGAISFYGSDQARDVFDTLFVMEPLKEDFVDWMKSARDSLFLDEKIDVCELEAEFVQQVPELEVLMRNIAIYFFNTYFCGAVYDEYILSQAKLSVFSAYTLKYLWLAKYKENSHTISKEEMGQLLYKYCRELENCTENLLSVLRHLDQHIFS